MAMVADLKTLKRARYMRQNMTEEETILWSDLRGLRQKGLAFRRQVPIGVFIVDFLCRKAKLIVEVDGNHHAENDKQWEHDQERDRWLKQKGYKVLRFWNSDIRSDLNNVMDKIYDEAKARTRNKHSNSSFPPPLGGGVERSDDGGGNETILATEDSTPPSRAFFQNASDTSPQRGGKG